jgi:hypothetical protein
MVHQCTLSNPKRQKIEVVDDQGLRELRHRCNATGSFVVYQSCTSGKWTNSEVVEKYLTKHGHVPQLTSYPSKCKRLKSMVIEHQQTGNFLPSCVVQAPYNHHIHTNCSCFKTIGKAEASNQKNTDKVPKSKKKRYKDECRYHYPLRAFSTWSRISIII